MIINYSAVRFELDGLVCPVFIPDTDSTKDDTRNFLFKQHKHGIRSG